MPEPATATPQGGQAMRPRTPIHLWVVGVLAFLWNLLGAFDYLATQLKLDFYMSQFTPEQLEYFYGFPAWMVAAWALAVWSALAGSIGLLLRQAWAVWAFWIALAGLVVSTIYNFGLSEGAEIMGSAAVAFTAVIYLVTGLLVWYSVRMKRRGVLA